MKGLIRLATRVEDGILVLLLTAMIAIAGGQILLRNLLETGFAWSDPLLRVLVLWISLAGAMVASRDHNHIAIDILSRYLSPRIKRINWIATDLFTALVCALLAYHGARLVLLDKEAETLAFGNVPAWVCELIIPIGFGVIALRFFLFFFQNVHDTFRSQGATINK